MSEETIQQVHAVFKVKGKIAAIKLFRKEFGGSLIQAKNAVEQIADGTFDESLAAEQGSDLDEEVDAAIIDRVLDEIQYGNRVKACKIYKDATNVSLAESKAFVDRLMRELDMEVPSAGGCAAAVLLLAAFAISVTVSFA